MEKNSLQDFLDPKRRRELQMGIKSEAVWVVFLELGGLINVSRLAREYFSKSQSWMAQRINGYTINHKECSFTPEEYRKLSASFRDIATRLNRYADEIDAAE